MIGIDSQFLYQIYKEREWIKDELQSRGSTGTVDIEAKAKELAVVKLMRDLYPKNFN